MDKQIRARIPEELSDKIDNYLIRLNADENDDRKVNLSDIIRNSVREYLEDNSLDEKGNMIKIRVDKTKYLVDDMDEISNLIKELSEKYSDNRSMSYVCTKLRAVLLLMRY